MGGNSEEQKRFLASGAGSTAQIDFGEAGRGQTREALNSLLFFIPRAMASHQSSQQRKFCDPRVMCLTEGSQNG